MKRLYVLVCALCFCAGCAADKEQWEDFKKDWRGDNMRMKNDYSQLDRMDDHPVQIKSRD